MNKLVAQTMAKKQNGEKGFTLIELLVVVIIIGVLAAIAIPVFLNMRQGAWTSSVESDVKNAVLAVETAASANNGKISDLGPETAQTGNFSIVAGSATTALATVVVSPNNTITITTNADNSYSVTGASSNLTDAAHDLYTYTSTSGKGLWG